MISLEKFMPFVHPKLKNAPYEIVLHEIVMSARDLCTNAAIWVEDFKFDIQANVVDYPVELVSCAEPVRAHEAWIGTTRWQGPHPLCSGPNYYGCAVCHQHVTFPEPRHLQLTQAPAVDVADGGFVRIQAQPTLDAYQVHPVVFEQYVEAVQYGALARLYSGYPQEKFYNPSGANLNERMFTREKTRAKNRVTMGNRVGSPRMTGSYF